MAEVALTPDERLSQLSDLIIQSVIRPDEESIKNRRYLFGQVHPSIFRNENYVIYWVLYNFKEKSITPDEDFLKLYLVRNTRVFKDGADYIDLSEFSDLDDNVNIAYASAVLKQFNRLLTLEPQKYDDFRLTIEKYKQEYCALELNSTYSQAKLILYDGAQYGKRFFQGYSDSVSYSKKKFAEIDSIIDSTAGVGFIDSSVAGLDDSDISIPVKVGDFDLIEELNERLGGIFTEIFYNIVAPTKGGKSKFTARLIHTAVVKYHQNVAVWAVEGGYQAWWAQLRAIHYEYTYIRSKPDGEKVAPLSQADILYDRYPSDAIKALEASSRQDLFSNPSYGNIGMIERPFMLETFIDDIDTQVKINNAKIVLVDYLQLIGSSNRQKQKSQVISEAYQKALRYCKSAKVAFISPSQFKQDFMDEMAKSKDGKTHEVRTAGGESSEVIRTPDINIALYASTEDLMRKEMTIMSMPSRLSEPFPDTKIYADLCSCVFSSIKEQ